MKFLQFSVIAHIVCVKKLEVLGPQPSLNHLSLDLNQPQIPHCWTFNPMLDVKSKLICLWLLTQYFSCFWMHTDQEFRNEQPWMVMSLLPDIPELSQIKHSTCCPCITFAMFTPIITMDFFGEKDCAGSLMLTYPKINNIFRLILTFLARPSEDPCWGYNPQLVPHSHPLQRCYFSSHGKFSMILYK